jgi:2-keto-4-pentenoate hydratase
MDDAVIEKLGEDLYRREKDRTPRAPLSEEYPDLSVEDAYRIQRRYADLRAGRDGATIVGQKIGATSKAIQELFGIDTPDYGLIFDDMMIPDGGTVSLDELIAPMVEPEIAFRLGTDLRGPGLTAADVLAATTDIVACLEIIDSRIEGWRIGFADTVADNGSSSRCVIGAHPVPLDGRDLVAERVSFRRDGVEFATATGAAVLGHPAASVAWLGNALGGYGQSLKAGEWLLSGSLTTADRARPGARYEAVFSTVGSVSCQFTEEPNR